MCFYFGKNAFSALRSLWVPKVCVAANGAMRFSVRSFGYALFYCMEVEKMVIALSVLVVLAVNFLFATLMNNIAVSKGYENSHAFALVFFFGVLGMLYVIALPDLKAQEQREDILTILLEKNGEK